MAEKEDLQVDEAMVERALSAYWKSVYRERSANFRDDMRAALLAALNPTDGSVVSAARGTEVGPESESSTPTAPRPVSTTRAAIERQVAGALKSCVDAHGPITVQFITSAAKRVVGALNISESEEA
jgi:hypothetical protein